MGTGGTASAPATSPGGSQGENGISGAAPHRHVKMWVSPPFVAILGVNSAFRIPPRLSLPAIACYFMVGGIPLVMTTNFATPPQSEAGL